MEVYCQLQYTKCDLATLCVGAAMLVFWMCTNKRVFFPPTQTNCLCKSNATNLSRTSQTRPFQTCPATNTCATTTPFYTIYLPLNYYFKVHHVQLSNPVIYNILTRPCVLIFFTNKHKSLNYSRCLVKIHCFFYLHIVASWC